MKKILIFGASGDTGRYLIDYILEQQNSEYEIIAVGRRESANYIYKNIEYISVDITNQEDFNQLPTDIYAVIDLAGYMPARMEGYYPQKYFEINTIGTLNILEFCRENSIDRFIFATSFGDILGNLKNDILLKSDSPISFSYNTDHTAYVISKRAAVELMKNYHDMFGLKTFVFRLPTIYLWSENENYYVDGEIRKLGYRLLIDKAIKGETIEVFGDPTRLKDMVYVKDFCQMVYKALSIEKDEGIYNVGTGIGTSLLEIVKGIIKVFSDPLHPSEIVFKPEMPDTPQYIMDISNAKEELGYEPEYDYISMLQDLKDEMSMRLRNSND